MGSSQPLNPSLRMAPTSPARPLLYASSEQSADALYFGRVGVPDAFVAFGLRGHKYAVVSALEFNRVRRQSVFDRVLPLEKWMKLARAQWPRRQVGAAEVIALLARKFRSRRFTVPGDFPAGLCQRLRRHGLEIDIAPGMLFPEREIKSPAEIAALRTANRCSAAGIAAAKRVLRASRIRSGRLFYRGELLTSERLKVAVEIACLEAGSTPANTIVAGGDQACDPHDRGSGPLRANSLIIVDVFPRVAATGYFGDMTRTFLRGRASPAQRALVAAVREAQLAALATVRAGIDPRTVHESVTSVFKARGFKTKKKAGRSVGFIHGTGHGVGLDIHEPPRINAVASARLLRGTVVTVEPGLYYPGLGGCRIEDVVQVTHRAPRMLSDFPYDWELG
jgi:Xaa-Pro aminopeptidase